MKKEQKNRRDEKTSIRAEALRVKKGEHFFVFSTEFVSLGGGKAKELKSNRGFEWDCLVAAWRYYEYRTTASSAGFPGDIIDRYFAPANEYNAASRKGIAEQFANVDHYRNGEDDWIKLNALMECDKRPWCKFYAFCRAYIYGFSTVVLDGKIGGKKVHEEPKCFFCKFTNHWYPVDLYLSNPEAEGFCNESFIKEVK